MDALAALDSQLLEGVRALACPLMDQVMVLCTRLGDLGLVWLVMAALLLLNRRTRPYGWLLLCALVCVTLVTHLLLKPLVGRIRPCNLWPQVPLLIPRELGSSFPSGHAASSFASATAVLLAHRRRGWWACLLAAAIGLSRVYLFVHFPSDVLAGAILGVLTTLTLHRLWQRRQRASL